MKRENGLNLIGLVNLVIVALLGFLLRLKMVFPIPFLDYRNLLSAHGNFAVSGWIGLMLMVLVLHNLVPEAANRGFLKKTLLLFAGISWLMLLCFVFAGPGSPAFFSYVLLILLSIVIAAAYSAAITRSRLNRAIKWAAVSALVSMVLAASGIIGLALLYSGNWPFMISYRDLNYTFLHFQYNGFFSVAIIAMLATRLTAGNAVLPPALSKGLYCLVAATLPTLFLSILYHEKTWFYFIAAAGGSLLMISTIYFIIALKDSSLAGIFRGKMEKTLVLLALFSYLLKIVMQLGTLVPSLGHAIYSDRPVIIGFLHLVFLAFASFYIIAELRNKGWLGRKSTPAIIIFAAGVLLNEIILFLQGLLVLFNFNSQYYNVLLLVATFIILAGAVALLAGALKEKEAG